MIDKITGIILAGGKSSRMGRDKSFIEFSGRPLIEALIDKLSVLFRDLVIITNKPDCYKQYGLKIYTDKVKDRGPLGGIYTALAVSGQMYNFIVACDMPFVNLDLINYMISNKEGNDCIIPQWEGKVEPLFGLYSKKCLFHIESQLKSNDLRIANLFSKVKTMIIAESEIKRFDLGGSSFTNINTKDDCQYLLKNRCLSLK